MMTRAGSPKRGSTSSACESGDMRMKCSSPLTNSTLMARTTEPPAALRSSSTHVAGPFGACPPGLLKRK